MQLFDIDGNIRNDGCAQTAKDFGNASISDYTLWNTYMMQCDAKGEKHLEDFSTGHVNLHYRNGYGYTTACEVDVDTEVRLNGKITHEKPKTQLFTRPFVAVPDLSRGVLVPGVESRLQQGDDTTQVRECFRLTEYDYDRFVPLIPCLADNVQNPKHIIMPWTQGGDNSRAIMRKSETLKACGFKDNGKYWEKQK